MKSFHLFFRPVTRNATWKKEPYINGFKSFCWEIDNRKSCFEYIGQLRAGFFRGVRGVYLNFLQPLATEFSLCVCVCMHRSFKLRIYPMRFPVDLFCLCVCGFDCIFANTFDEILSMKSISKINAMIYLFYFTSHCYQIKSHFLFGRL